MEYFIYNNTDYTVSVPDVHYNNTFEAGAGGSFGTTNVFRIEPHSWNTTRRCKSDEVEASISGGILFGSVKKGNVIVCTREEYEVKTRQQASSRLESSMGISGQEKEAQQGFGFLNKVVKKSATPSININDFLISDEETEEVVDDTPEVIEVKDDSRITALEEQMSSMKGALDNIAALLQAQKAPKKSVKKAVKKPATKKKTNAKNKHGK